MCKHIAWTNDGNPHTKVPTLGRTPTPYTHQLPALPVDCRPLAVVDTSHPPSLQHKDSIRLLGHPPIRAHEVFIMEAVNELGLNTNQLERINACCMFLQIMTLAEITDNSGQHLLPHALLQPNKAQPEGLDAISTSTLDWLARGTPTKATWQLWTQTIRELFTGSATGTKLRHPLGEWLDTYQNHRFWKWRVSSTGHMLHKKHPTAHPRAALKTQTTHTYVTFSLTIPTNQPFQGPPVTLLNPQCRQIHLPVTELGGPTILATPWTCKSLVTQFRHQLPTWQ